MLLVHQNFVKSATTHWNLAVSGSRSRSSLTGDLGMCLLNFTTTQNQTRHLLKKFQCNRFNMHVPWLFTGQLLWYTTNSSIWWNKTLLRNVKHNGKGLDPMQSPENGSKILIKYAPSVVPCQNLPQRRDFMVHCLSFTTFETTAKFPNG